MGRLDRGPELDPSVGRVPGDEPLAASCGMLLAQLRTTPKSGRVQFALRLDHSPCSNQCDDAGPIISRLLPLARFRQLIAQARDRTLDSV